MTLLAAENRHVISAFHRTAQSDHLAPSSLYHNCKKIGASIGLPDARLHDLRHSFAVAPLRAGDDIKTVQGDLGHRAAGYTLDVYGPSQRRWSRPAPTGWNSA